MRRRSLLVVVGVLAFAPDAAQAATISVHLVDPPVVGRQPLTVQVAVTGAVQGDGYQLYLTRGGCPETRGFEGSLAAGDSTVESQALQQPPPYHGTTFAVTGPHTICGYLGHQNSGPQGEPLPPTITATASEVVIARNPAVKLSLTSASYSERTRTLKVGVRGSSETDPHFQLYLASPGTSCPTMRPRAPSPRPPLQLVVTRSPDAGRVAFNVITKKKRGKLRRGRYRLCGYLIAGPPPAGGVQASAERRLRVGPA
jgi:hypothetical protein